MNDKKGMTAEELFEQIRKYGFHSFHNPVIIKTKTIEEMEKDKKEKSTT